MTTFPKSTTVDTTILQPIELIYMDFSLYNLTSFLSFTSMITLLCANNIMLWLFPTVLKIPPVQIICFVLKTFKNEQPPFSPVIVY